MSEHTAEKDAPAPMHAAVLDDPFGGTACGATAGWRTQITSDVTCPDCLNDPRVIPPDGTDARQAR